MEEEPENKVERCPVHFMTTAALCIVFIVDLN